MLTRRSFVQHSAPAAQAGEGPRPSRLRRARGRPPRRPLVGWKWSPGTRTSSAAMSPRMCLP